MSYQESAAYRLQKQEQERIQREQAVTVGGSFIQEPSGAV